jgi:histidine triad (HIT) family protein
VTDDATRGPGPDADPGAADTAIDARLLPDGGTVDDCVLCEAATRDVHGPVVHETPHALAVLEPSPVARGHTLVVPKDHYQRLGDLPADQAADLFRAMREVLPRITAAVDADGVTVGIDDGEAAGQELLHLHVELIPRVDGDGGGPIHAAFPHRPTLSDETLDDVAAATRTALRGDDGSEGPTP